MVELSASASATLAAWFSRKPSFALMGEFSAGKSTLLNLLLGGDVLPTQVTATNMPVIWMTYAEEPSAYGLGHDGALHECDIAMFGKQEMQDYLLVKLAMPVEILKRVDIIDTPGISDPRLALDALKFLGPYLDFVLWCTAANQAWRQTEKAMWTSLPEALRAQSILVLTRADTLKKVVDLEKVIRRCEREAGDLFRTSAPVAALSAIGARTDSGEVADQSIWEKSHAAALFESLDESITFATQACAGRETIDVPEAKKTDPPVPKKPAKTRSTGARKKSPKPESRTVKSDIKKTQAAGKNSATSNVYGLIDVISKMRISKKGSPSNDQFFDTLDHHFNTFLSETELSETHQMVLRRMMILERSDDASQDGILVQLERELEDFTVAPWCKLDQIN